MEIGSIKNGIGVDRMTNVSKRLGFAFPGFELSGVRNNDWCGELISFDIVVMVVWF